MASLKFTKMSGAGNDFVVFDNRDGGIPEERAELVRRVCARRVGVGADGALFVEQSEASDFRMRYYNADGGEAEMCGNGGRCISRYAYLNGMVGEKMAFETMAGRYRAEIVGELVRLEMVPPKDIRLQFEINVDGYERTINFIHTGVPHVVVFSDRIDDIDVPQMGRKIREHEKFAPAGANANFVQVVDRGHIRIRTYERGVEDETLACGTGTVAAALVGALLKRLRSPVEAITRSGLILTVHFDLKGKKCTNVFLEGNAEVIFEGVLARNWMEQ
ncbi:MAG: diaminopimelate epimerase [Candidatus Latescibacteria bacterium]|nr:diaminopimelate epimerase [Candidatus Latescibacterota bacterium]